MTRVQRAFGLMVLLAAFGALVAARPAIASTGTATDCCGGTAAWTTGNKSALGTSATTASTVWFTVADGITSEVFSPRADVPDMQDMQYLVTDGSSFVDLERDATSHTVSMPDEKALEYTVTNTATSGRYRITNTYLTDPDRDTLVVRTRFQSLDGGSYQLYLLANPSMAGGGGHDTASYDAADGALRASDTQTLFGSSTTVASALTVSGGFTAHDNGYVGAASDCNVDLRTDRRLDNQYDAVSAPGNVVQCGRIAVGADSTFTVALGYGDSASAASSAANGSLSAGFTALEANYRAGWNSYVDSLRPAPASVSGDTTRRRTYYVAAMALHAAEDKTYRGASVAGLATPWGAGVDGDALNDGYHRVWGRDLYQQATGLLAAGDAAQARRMAEFLWNRQYIATPTPGDATTYPAGSFPRYSPVSGVAGATPQQLGCCEQLDQEADAIILAYSTGLTDAGSYAKIRTTADHIRSVGPATTERWEEQYGISPSSVAAEIAGLVCAAAIARDNGDAASAANWEATADSWHDSLTGQTVTTAGYWGSRYYERLDTDGNPDDTDQLCSAEGCFYQHDVVGFGFLELVRLGVRPAADADVAASVAPSTAGSDDNSTMRVTLPNGDMYFHRYVHDDYGESNTDCTGWHGIGSDRGRLWPVLSGERGEYELANGRSAGGYLQSMADAGNDGHFVPEQIWDRTDVSCFPLGRPTGSAAPLMWAEGQYLRLARAIDTGSNSDTIPVVRDRYAAAGAR